MNNTNRKNPNELTKIKNFNNDFEKKNYIKAELMIGQMKIINKSLFTKKER